MDEIITYLEMTDPAALCGPRRMPPSFTFDQCRPVEPSLHRWLYMTVGTRWQWNDRADWRLSDWAAYGRRDDIELWVARREAAIVGFVELARQADRHVEIVYFGLCPAFIGCGYGAAVLAAGVRAAWQGDTRRVWLHTCNFDHPRALANYTARGFVIHDVRYADGTAITAGDHNTRI
ncbi:GNAT family N-acetyltransferase [Salinisphaera sp. Q1T1-3]|uniref:GNAT family N-acetyltransferase n=1 Tax=Salinisphaera sp. Q1T1-3 TaxID=2321229 RepID=UPI00131401DA|nr:GNAT family N-acetyltransferase [Salinisphaera sp. Q1T1-3]